MSEYVMEDHCSLDLSAANGGREDGRREQKKGERMEELKDKEKEMLGKYKLLNWEALILKSNNSHVTFCCNSG